MMPSRGMTELAPIGTIGGIKGALAYTSPVQRMAIKTKQGRPHVLCDMRIVDDEGKVSGCLCLLPSHAADVCCRCACLLGAPANRTRLGMMQSLLGG